MVHIFDEELAGVVAPAEWKGDGVVERLPTAKGPRVAVVGREAARLCGNRSVFSVHAFGLLARLAVGDEDRHPAATPRAPLVDARTPTRKWRLAWHRSEALARNAG